MSLRKLAVATVSVLATIGDSDGNAKEADPRVSVCVEKSVDVTSEAEEDVRVVGQAEWIVTQMFAGIGIRIAWHGYASSCPMSDQPIIINIGIHTPKAYFPAALGFALPYEGGHIRVFYDRVRTATPQAGVTQPGRAADLLAHVLAHEITHILQVSNSHSDLGVMKAKWSDHDYAQMRRTPLAFTDYDVKLIRRGLEVRKFRLDNGTLDRANGGVAIGAVQ
jgi:hypothetical protein